jgi:XTP/dITP diphosphohydrolase
MSGDCKGAIGYEQRCTNGFGYDPVFMVGDRTMAELTADEKNKISHRGAALRELYSFLKERYGD